MKSLCKLTTPTVVALLAFLSCFMVRAQSNNTLAVVSIQPLPTLTEKFAAAGKSLSLRYVSEAMDGQLIASLNNTRKFKIYASSDLKQIIKQQDAQNSGNYNLNDPNTSQQFKLAGIKWGLITTVDDFEDQTEKLQNNASRTLVTKRTVRLGATCKIYDITKGELLEAPSTNFTRTSTVETLLEASNNAQATDELLGRVTRDMAKWAAQNVVYKAFTVRVIAKTDRQVTINLGEEAGAVVGQIWTANAPGKELKDPDTGEVLGREEIQVGKIKITGVQPKLSKGEILDGDLGVAEGAVLRLSTAGNAP